MENLKRKVDAIYQHLFSGKEMVSPTVGWTNLREIELEDAIRKAIHELELTKQSFKSKQILMIKEELERILEKKA